MPPADPTGTQQLLAILGSVGVPGCILFAAIALFRGWVVPGNVYERAVRERDQAIRERDLAIAFSRRVEDTNTRVIDHLASAPSPPAMAP